MGKARPSTRPAVTPARPPVRIPGPGGRLPALPAAHVPVRAPADAAGAAPFSPSANMPAVPPESTDVPGLRKGCYLLRFDPVSADAPVHQVHYHGTLRVERNGATVTASGDLYLHRQPIWPGGGPVPANPEPIPGNGIPIFPRDDYRYYVRVTAVAQTAAPATAVTLGLEFHRFERANNIWTNEGSFTTELTPTTAPAGFPSANDYLTGAMKDAAGTVVGSLAAGWVSEKLRRAVIEIDCVAGCESPRNNGAETGWRDVFEQVDWELTDVLSDTNVAEPDGGTWTNDQLHVAMLAQRDSNIDLDREWRYHVLCVRSLESGERGVMYDTGATDSNNVAREGIALAAHWAFPDRKMWGDVRGRRFGAAAAPYFRTALHEIGHAMGLGHNTADNGIMNTTEEIADNATAPPFPGNIRWQFAPDDAKRLRHLPDIWVRPGGVPYGLESNSTPVSPFDLIEPATGLMLEVTPLLDAVPIGAPVRLDVAVVNVTDRPLPVPRRVGLSSGNVSGKVIDTAAVVRSFSPLVMCLDEQATEPLGPGERRADSMTLLRGPQGPLFPIPGVYRISVDLDWEVTGVKLGITGEAAVLVRPAENKKHAEAALRLLAEPDAHLTLVLGGDHLPQGVRAIQHAVKDRVLRPHYAAVESRRLGRRCGDRKADPHAVAALIDESAVLSAAELRRAAEMVRRENFPDAVKEQLAKVLKKKASLPGVPNELRALVESLGRGKARRRKRAKPRTSRARNS